MRYQRSRAFGADAGGAPRDYRRILKLMMSYVRVRLTPTLPHCHVCHLIGLCIYTNFSKAILLDLRSIRVAPGSHATEAAGTIFQTTLVSWNKTVCYSNCSQ
ncbi:protein AE7 [Raphanus sativus]|uniref:Protein AE7 n=1 Tax=Raphanus sativus TaxID=3726 RepID=A0A9W3DR98_RAPSA|nr:protein AE7 [Raphanus sativus]